MLGWWWRRRWWFVGRGCVKEGSKTDCRSVSILSIAGQLDSAAEGSSVWTTQHNTVMSEDLYSAMKSTYLGDHITNFPIKPKNLQGLQMIFQSSSHKTHIFCCDIIL